jgi:hypothetical protein
MFLKKLIDLISRNIDVVQVPKATNFSVSGAKLGAATIYVHNGLCLINIFISMALRYRGKLENPIPKEQVLCYLTFVNITRNQV